MRVLECITPLKFFKILSKMEFVEYGFAKNSRTFRRIPTPSDLSTEKVSQNSAGGKPPKIIRIILLSLFLKALFPTSTISRTAGIKLKKTEGLTTRARDRKNPAPMNSRFSNHRYNPASRKTKPGISPTTVRPLSWKEAKVATSSVESNAVRESDNLRTKK